MPSIALARADARVVPPAAGGRADNENSRYRRFPPTGGRPGTQPAGPAEATARPARQGGRSRVAIRQNARIIPSAGKCRLLQWPTIYPRCRPFADGTLKCATAAINMPSGRPLSRNFRTVAGRHHGIIAAKRLVPRSPEGPGPFPRLPGLSWPPHRLVTCPGRLPPRRHRNSTEISVVH